MSINTSLVSFLNAIEGFPPTHYQHASGTPGARFAWVLLNGSDYLGETLDRGQEPDIMYFDLEIYSNDLADLEAAVAALFAMQDYEGEFGDGEILDLTITDQRDDYTPLADGEDLPEFSVFFRLEIIGYGEED